MISAGGDFDLLGFTLARHAIHEPMLAGDTPRPPSLKCVLQRLGLAEPLERISPDVLDEVVDRFQNLGIGRLPMEVILPGRIRPKKSHGASERLSPSAISRSTKEPASASSTDRSRRVALAGLRKRCRVSMI